MSEPTPPSSSTPDATTIETTTETLNSVSTADQNVELNVVANDSATTSSTRFADASQVGPPRKPMGPFKKWMLQGHPQHTEGAYESEKTTHHQHAWWKVMCLTGVDYFSTLGYQPGIAALAAGALSPIATFILILLTLFGALPVYNRVAKESPHGEGSISMLEHLFTRWKSKLFVLILLGFVATDFVITITLSAADATAHVIENPFMPHFLHDNVTASILITLVFVTLLGAVFLKGFKEAIGIAVVLVGIYLSLNLVVVGRGLWEVFSHPEHFPEWQQALLVGRTHGNPILMLGVSLLLFPKLALGLSGFETGVAVMPLVKGHADDTYENPRGRIVNTRKLLVTAALIMSVFLMASSISTTLLIKPEAFYSSASTPEAREALAGLTKELGRPLDQNLIGDANGRALAYLAHNYFGDVFGTIYDISTIAILWFAGASAMAGLLNIVPRYLPRYGMAPDWALATRPLALVFTLIAFAVTILFKASVDAQGAAYATGVLVLMSSAAVAVTITAARQKVGKFVYALGLIAVVFVYTTIVNIFERPEGLKIASFFILAIVFVSFISRISRTTELRVERVEMDEAARRFIEEIGKYPIRVIANKRQAGDMREYVLKEDKQREDSHIPAKFPILFLEIDVLDASEFSSTLQVRGVDVDGYRVLRAESATVPNAVAALLLHIRDITGKRPHAYFNWSEGNPLVFMMRYLLLGEGDTAPVTREVLRKAERDVNQRPMIHVDG